MSNKTPNFFIVGAPKCGTTSMYQYLRQHPDIFMPYEAERFWLVKEPHYFATDLGMGQKVRLSNRQEYMDLFKHAVNERRIGEASALYLYSSAAVSQIKQLADECSTETKIIIMLRPPIEMMQSWHKDCLRWGHEDIGSFDEAIRAEPDRKQGKRIPRYCEYPSRLIYTEMGRYLSHTNYYIDTFGRDNVLIILLEDLNTDPNATYQTVLEFLDVDSTFIPNFDVHNQAAKLNETHVSEQRLKLFLIHNMRIVYTLFSKLSLRQQEFIRSLPKQIMPRETYKADDEEFVHNLRSSYAPEVQQLGQLINRDLAHWCN